MFHHHLGNMVSPTTQKQIYGEDDPKVWPPKFCKVQMEGEKSQWENNKRFENGWTFGGWWGVGGLG